jgi:hypothetical protein
LVFALNHWLTALGVTPTAAANPEALISAACMASANLAAKDSAISSSIMSVSMLAIRDEAR